MKPIRATEIFEVRFEIMGTFREESVFVACSIGTTFSDIRADVIPQILRKRPDFGRMRTILQLSTIAGTYAAHDDDH